MATKSEGKIKRNGGYVFKDDQYSLSLPDETVYSNIQDVKNSIEDYNIGDSVYVYELVPVKKLTVKMVVDEMDMED